MLDNQEYIAQHDPSGALKVADQEYQQTNFPATILNAPETIKPISQVIVTGMGGSALAAMMMKVWTKDKLKVPFEIVKSYDLPAYVNESTLVICSSYSGNTEETMSTFVQAQKAHAMVSIISAGGHLVDKADIFHASVVKLPTGFQPRMAVNFNLKALALVLVSYKLLPESALNEIATEANFVERATREWLPNVPTEHNYAKQIAVLASGKTPVFYGGSLTSPIAYKFKIGWNENAKNVAFNGEVPESNHNDFAGWTSHPIEKPFAIFDIVSSFEHPRVIKRFDLADRLLSGQRPASKRIDLQGDTLMQQLLWGGAFADFASIYAGILNGVDPTQVSVIEQLKIELAKES